MQRLFAIAGLTWKAAFRFRLFWVLLALLLGSVLVLPLLIKDDGTARGLTQILLTYTLSLITALLGLSTLWLACGTLARDIEDCQVQLVAVKPIARWQIWLGKWLGLVLLDAALLALAGGSVFAMLEWRARGLRPEEQRILRQEIFVARASLKEPAPDLDRLVEQAFRDRTQRTPVPPEEHAVLRRELREQFLAGVQVVPPGYARLRSVDLGYRQHFLRNEPLYIRAKFHVSRTNASGTYLGRWIIGPTNAPQRMMVRDLKLANDTFHELEVPPSLVDEGGRLNVVFQNGADTAMLFPLEDGFEVLYREGGFGLNFGRGLLVILCWLALLAAMGLAAASFLSFPVAAFISASLLFVALSSGTLTNAVSEGTVFGLDHESGAAAVASWIDTVMIPIFKGILGVVNLAQAFSPVDALSTGRSITWGQVGQAVFQVVVLLGGIFAALGMVIFTRRELATAPSNL